MNRSPQDSLLAIERRFIDKDLDSGSSFAAYECFRGDHLSLVPFLQIQIATQQKACQKQSTNQSGQQPARVAAFFFLDWKRCGFQVIQCLHSVKLKKKAD